MPYVFRESQVGEPRASTEFPSLTSEVLEETFAQAFEENPVASIARFEQLREDRHTGQKLDAKAARQRLADRGMEQDIAVSEAGITEDALDTLMFRKGIEKRRQEIFGQAEGGLAQGAARLGVGLGTSLVDPLSVATAFIPVVGQARYAGMLARAGGALGRTGVRAGVGAAEGAAGAALLEPIIAGSRRYEQADYDMADSLLNVAFGGVFGAGLHSTFGAVSDGVTHYRGAEPAWRGLEGLKADEIPLVQNLRAEIERGMDVRDIARATEGWTESMRKAVEPNLPRRTPAEDAHETLPPIARENAIKQAIVQAVMDEPVNVQPIVRRAAARQTETPEFQRWFGESLVVDKSRQPLRVYHGTRGDFDRFELARQGQESGQMFSRGIYLTADPEYAGSMAAARAADGASVVPAYVSLKNPRVFESYEAANKVTAAEWKRIESDGTYDGVIVLDQDKMSEVIAFRPEQIKSAIGNSGRFDSNSASLTDPMTDVAKANAYAEKALARETDTGAPTADALKNATEEASLARSDLQALAGRLGEEVEDAELKSVLEAAANADRWAKVAELATVCLTRGG